jgi:molecular chaperone GrpE
MSESTAKTPEQQQDDAAETGQESPVDTPSADTAPGEAESAVDPGADPAANPTEAPDLSLAPETEPSREDALAAEVAGLKDQLLRALAESENIRKRAERDKTDARRYAATELARDLLSVADNLRRALDSAAGLEVGDDDQALKGLIDGVAMTERDLLGALERNGVKKIEPLDEPFDHNLHQAMYEVPNSGKPAGTVVELLQPGYVIHDRLLRPAMVGVAKADAPETAHKPIDTTA